MATTLRFELTHPAQITVVLLVLAWSWPVVALDRREATSS
jgi:hypothetical protein